METLKRNLPVTYLVFLVLALIAGAIKFGIDGSVYAGLSIMGRILSWGCFYIGAATAMTVVMVTALQFAVLDLKLDKEEQVIEERRRLGGAGLMLVCVAAPAIAAEGLRMHATNWHASNLSMGADGALFLFAMTAIFMTPWVIWMVGRERRWI